MRAIPVTNITTGATFDKKCLLWVMSKALCRAKPSLHDFPDSGPLAMTQFVTPSFLLSPWLVLGSLLTLTACGGGSSGGGSNGGQQPDPVVVDIPVAYIQRPIPLDEDGEPVYPDVFMPDSFNPGGELYLKARATTQAEVVNITRAAFAEHEFFDAENPNYDVKDVAVDSAGTRLLFAMRAPLDPDLDEDDEDQPTWNIWEYHLATKILRRVISSDFEAEKGHDVSPRYLPDGRIIFSSNRQKRSKEILLDEGKPQFGAVTTQDNDITSFLLHSVKDDGTDIQQLSYHLSHDLQPQVMPDGRLVFMRWSGEQLSFYSANPDGTDVQRYFGDESLNQPLADDMTEVPRLLRPQILPDGRIAAIYLQNGLQLGGDMVVVDGAAALEGAVQSLSVKPVNIATDLVSLHGRFASLSPLYDGTNRLLVSWSQCRLLETATERLQPCLPTLLVDGVPAEGYEEAPPFYGLWIYDLNNQTQLPVVLAEDGKVFTEALALEQSAYNPAFIQPTTDPDLAARNLGLLHIRSVYDLDGAFSAMNSGAADLQAMIARPADQRPARFIRLVKAVSRIDDDTLNDQDDNVYGNLFGANTDIEEILGYAPVEADGSVMVMVPADVAFNLEVLDANGHRIVARIDQWVTLRPGERRDSNGLSILERGDFVPEPINRGAPTTGNFLNTQRYDAQGLPKSPEMSQTMAEFASQSTYCEDPVDPATCYPMTNIKGNLRAPSVDLIYRDEWTVPSLPRTASFAYRYNDLVLGATPDQIAAPTPTACREESSWNANCRVVINYEYHIQPLWERERTPLGACLGCHTSSIEIDTQVVPKLPDGQLELARTKANANTEMLSFLQLTQQRAKQLVDNGIPSARGVAVPVCEFEVDDDDIPECVITLDEEGLPTCDNVIECPFVTDEETGDVVLGEDGMPEVRDELPGAIDSPMNAGSARNSGRFFNKFLYFYPEWNSASSYVVGDRVYFDSGLFLALTDNQARQPNVDTNAWRRVGVRDQDYGFEADTVDHRDALNPAELKLLSEWLDTGGRYYTNPFELAVPN